MSNELTIQNGSQELSTMNSGSVAIEQQRAIAEAQGQMILAKRFPRDLTSAHAELMDACKSSDLASIAFYSLPRGGTVVSGPSIRLAEEVARVVGNIEYGHRELSRTDSKSEVEVYAWDKQTNTRSIRQLTVMHVIDTKQGPKKCRDQRDIDDLIANKASKQLRGRILAVMPKWLVESAVRECKKTIAGENKDKPISARIRDMAHAFSKMGVTTDHLELWLGHKLDLTIADELVELTGVYNSIRDGHSKAGDFFGAKDDKPVGEDVQNLQSAIDGAVGAIKPKVVAKKVEQVPKAEEPPKAQEQPQAQPQGQTQPQKAEPKKQTPVEPQKVVAPQSTQAPQPDPMTIPELQEDDSIF